MDPSIDGRSIDLTNLCDSFSTSYRVFQLAWPVGVKDCVDCRRRSWMILASVRDSCKAEMDKAVKSINSSALLSGLD